MQTDRRKDGWITGDQKSALETLVKALAKIVKKEIEKNKKNIRLYFPLNLVETL